MTATNLRSSDDAEPIGADCADMRSTADALDRTNDHIGDIASEARGAAAAGVMLRTAIFSPGSAAKAEASLLQAAVVTSAITLRLEVVALVLRTKANLFELADAAKGVLFHLMSMVAWPAAMTVFIAAKLGFDPAQRLLAEFPVLTDIASTGFMSWVATGGGRRPPLPGDYDRALGLLQAGAWLFGWGSRPVVVGASCETKNVPIRGIADLVRSGVALEGATGASPTGSGVRVIRIDHPGGKTSWIVEIPGTDFAGGPHDPSNPVANADLMRGQGPLLDAVREAMARAGVQPGEHVLVSGHSQGGIAAMALARDPRGYAITNVVTAGSPVSVAALHPPPNVHVLSIEHREDPVVHTDGRANPETPNWTTITGDVGHDARVRDDPFFAHDGGLYAETAQQIDRQHLAKLPAEFLTGHGTTTTQTDFDLTAP